MFKLQEKNELKPLVYIYKPQAKWILIQTIIFHSHFS